MDTPWHWLMLGLMVLAAIGGIFNMLQWIWHREVSNTFFMCPYCPHTVRPGDRIVNGPLGWGHLGCSDWKDL